MNLFRLDIPTGEKIIQSHPWDNTIKLNYSNKIKTAHNSINNPQYPKKKGKYPHKNRVQFTVIGNRTTKEFVYSVKLVQALHKYRWKYFDAPIIRGATSVEWPQIWNDLKLEHGDLSFCLTTQVAVLKNNKFLGGQEELKKLIASKYMYYMDIDYSKETIEQFSNFIKQSGRPCAYMHISIDKIEIGTLIFMLYADIVPFTSENFLRLCKEKRGGYTGTPIHRIVTDGWIQGGGYGLKSTDLDCENFIVPHDRRGVLCMANDNRHVDCSTQFFVLLQPAPWMAHRYVAFGQLIDGESTLKAIENVPTWYEAPTSEIIIYKAGILNLDCQEIIINKGTREYINLHIEDLYALGEYIYRLLMENVSLEIELREIAKLTQSAEENGEEEQEAMDIHATKRFHRKMSDIHKQLLEKTQYEGAVDKENLEFDVEVYHYEPEEYSYQHVSLKSSVVPPEKPYYIPLTDVPYPGEIDSTFDLRRFLKGDYCLESDLDKTATRPTKPKKNVKHSVPPEAFYFIEEDDFNYDEVESEESMDSEEAQEIKSYLKLNSDRASFAGGIVRNIAKGIKQHYEGERISGLLTDDILGRFRLTTPDRRRSDAYNKKVNIHSEIQEKPTVKISRRQTGYPKSEGHIGKESSSSDEILEDDPTCRKVRIADSAIDSAGHVSGRPLRRPTAYNKLANEDMAVTRQSVLTRLFEDVAIDDFRPTLKGYKPVSETHQKNMLLTVSPYLRITSDDDYKDKYLRRPTIERETYDDLLDIQHAKRCVRKVSSDYVKTIDQAENVPKHSIRSIEFARTRPTMTVFEYQKKNQMFQEAQEEPSKVKISKVTIQDETFLKDHLLPSSQTVEQQLLNTPAYSSAASMVHEAVDQAEF